MATKLEAVLFDLDGTLIDSLPLILASFRHTLDEHGLDHVTEAAVREGIGTPLVEHFSRMAPGAEAVDDLVATYIAFNRSEHDRRVRPFQGVEAILDGLVKRDLPIGIVTSKRLALARRGLELCGLHHAFGVMVGPEEVTRPKPHPEPLLLAAQQLGLRPDRMAYVGDSHHDLAAANAAGMVSLGAAWGALDRDRLVREEPHALFDTPGELEAWLAASLPGEEAAANG